MDSVFESVFSSIDAFVYRCRNDADYTMDYMAGGVGALLGYDADDLVGNKTVSFVGLVSTEDAKQMVADIDLAIERGEPWDVSYRIHHKDGHLVWVRERGDAIYENGQLAYLQGLIVGAKAEYSLRQDIQDAFARTSAANRDIVGMMDNIAGSVRELSMLSINARIEAARSGEAGLGFAVVANEIKVLADRNAKWAKEITDRINEVGGENRPAA